MRPKKFDYDPDATDDNGLWTIAAIAGAGALTMNGALVSGGVATMDYARRIGIISAGNDSGITMTIVGTDADGLAQTEVVTMASGDTATSTKYFKTVTSLTASGASAGNVTIGTVDEFVSATIPIDGKSDSAATVNVDITGTINYTLQECFEPIHSTPTEIQSVTWSAITAFSAKTADVKSSASLGATALRFVVNSFTDTAEAQIYLAQPGR